jgi:hypothetical protein
MFHFNIDKMMRMILFRRRVCRLRIRFSLYTHTVTKYLEHKCNSGNVTASRQKPVGHTCNCGATWVPHEHLLHRNCILVIVFGELDLECTDGKSLTCCVYERRGVYIKQPVVINDNEKRLRLSLCRPSLVILSTSTTVWLGRGKCAWRSAALAIASFVSASSSNFRFSQNHGSQEYTKLYPIWGLPSRDAGSG